MGALRANTAPTTETTASTDSSTDADASSAEARRLASPRSHAKAAEASRCSFEVVATPSAIVLDARDDDDDASMGVSVASATGFAEPVVSPSFALRLPPKLRVNAVVIRFRTKSVAPAVFALPARPAAISTCEALSAADAAQPAKAKRFPFSFSLSELLESPESSPSPPPLPSPPSSPPSPPPTCTVHCTAPSSNTQFGPSTEAVSLITEAEGEASAEDPSFPDLEDSISRPLSILRSSPPVATALGVAQTRTRVRVCTLTRNWWRVVRGARTLAAREGGRTAPRGAARRLEHREKVSGTHLVAKGAIAARISPVETRRGPEVCLTCTRESR